MEHSYYQNGILIKNGTLILSKWNTHHGTLILSKGTKKNTHIKRNTHLKKELKKKTSRWLVCCKLTDRTCCFVDCTVGSFLGPPPTNPRPCFLFCNASWIEWHGLPLKHFLPTWRLFSFDSKDHPRSRNWTLDFAPAFSQRFYPTLRPRSYFPTRQRFSLPKHVTSGSMSPRSIFPTAQRFSLPKHVTSGSMSPRSIFQLLSGFPSHFRSWRHSTNQKPGLVSIWASLTTLYFVKVASKFVDSKISVMHPC